MTSHNNDNNEKPVESLARRDAMKYLAMASSIPFLSAGSALYAGQTAATGSIGGPSKGELPQWAEFVEMLKPAGELNNITLAPEDNQLRAELYRQFVMNLALGYFIYFQSDARFPQWIPFLNSAFLLQPNPDDVYYVSKVDDAGTYRIIGDRGTVRILSFALGHEIMGTTDRVGGGLKQYDDDDLPVNDDGSFEVIISPARPEGYSGTWWPMPSGAKSLLVRQRSYDWLVERDAQLAIERLDVPVEELKPRMPQAEIESNLRELLGGFTERLSRIWLGYQNRIKQSGPANTITMTDFSGAVAQQIYWQGLYQFAGDEALILETDMPDTHRYWNVQLNDSLWNATEYVYRQGSLNGHQARIDSDGKFRAVICVRDPGVHNWLDTCGYLEGMLIGRWYGASSHPLPTIKRVKLADLRSALPADTPLITAAERGNQLRQRRLGGQFRRRW